METIKIDARHESRIVLIQALYAYSFQQEKTLLECISIIRKEYPMDQCDEGIIRQVGEGIVESFPKLDTFIQKAAPEWPLDKISRVDLMILRLALFEIHIAQSVPYKVAINEAVELAKEFTGSSSAKFINGTLGSIIVDLGLVKK